MNNNLSFTILGNPIPKKNEHRIRRNPKTGQQYIGNDERFLAYDAACQMQIKAKYKQNISVPINLKCVYYRANAITVDLTNLLNATHDILVKGGVIKDDNFKIVRTVDGSTVFIDRVNPRVEIEITEVDDDSTDD